jgi:hypothetical protein
LSREAARRLDVGATTDVRWHSNQNPPLLSASLGARRFRHIDAFLRHLWAKHSAIALEEL